MKVINLADDITEYNGLIARHGLSFLICTDSHIILFDFGPDGATLKKNSAALGVDLSEVDIAFLSHGHIDHGGGLEYFLNVNKTARIYCKESAFDMHYSKHGFTHVKIGVPEYLKKNGRFVFVKNFNKIDDTLTVFSGVEDKKFHSPANDNLEVRRIGYGRIKDDFSHEINLIVTENKKKYLFFGCGHCGVVNILRKAEKCSSSKMAAAIGGFHLEGRTIAPDSLILDLAAYLSALPSSTVFYTCHCTGAAAYNILKSKMGDRIEYFMCGDVLKLT